VVEFGIPVLSLDLSTAVAVGGERCSDLKLRAVFLLHVGDHHMTAMGCRHDFWLRSLRLQPPKTASTQPPRRRPSEGFPVTHTRPFSPKWFHPQLEEGFAGGGEGLNCFLLYVLGYAKFYNYIVFLVFSGSCLYFVIHRQLIYCGTKPF
jgi:hypothetical protein